MTAKELRASILQLAVTGKLVSQDPNDEPASALIEKIKAEKAKLVKAGKIKKEKNPSEIVVGSDGAVYEKFKDGTVKDISDDIPFEIPKGWAWTRLWDICNYGESSSETNLPSVAWILELEDIEKDTGRLLQRVHYANRKSASAKRIFKKGMVLYSKLRTYLNKVLVADMDGYCTSEILPLDFGDAVNAEYSRFVLMSPYFLEYTTKCCYGTKMPRLGTEDGRKALFPLPPLAEQKRIVEKVERLMPLVEKYGELENHRLRLAADLPTALEKSILQEAIQGKLVLQDPNDEPASELLKRVATERKRLVKAGKLKANKAESIIFRGSDRLAYETRNGETVCIQDEIPFEIPDSWEWVRLGSISTIVRGSGIKRSETAGSGFPCIRYGEVYTTYGYSFLKARSFTSEAVATKCNKAHCGDVLCTLTGECKEEIAKASAYLGEVPIAIGGDLARISNHPYDPMLLVYFMFSPLLLSQKADKSNGDIIVHIGKEAIENLLLPLPPVAEQKRIADKITNLLAMIKPFTR